jgi:chromosome segregation ATPase
VETVNCEREVRLPFSYAWWSAYGYKDVVDQASLPPGVNSIPLVDQKACYDQVGKVMLSDLLDGHAVVLFAYGLSGSGKTFTVFGVDGAGDPDSWFQFDKPQPLWGIFPRLSYDLYNQEGSTPGFGASIKYFQNVHDTVRDLLSPAAVEKHFKEGMKLDKDGFMDMTWCRRRLVPSFSKLREIIGQANRRKCISPTQFNWCSTRGHCILEMEVANGISGTRGRLYLCDLAGAEPAGDIHYAKYVRVVDPETGQTQHNYVGKHPDQHKTSELQSQGKKINLSLSELTRFFRRLAELIKRKRFVPGQDLPGCNAFFLGKYLKKTILQAHTYLIAAVRPEVSYQHYTFSTLEFAHNASVVRLAPKKPMGKRQSAAASHITEEMERLKAMLREANAKNEELKLEEEEKLEEARLELSRKTKELEDHINQEEDNGREHEELMDQIEMYHERGIVMAGYDQDVTGPYLEKLDVDEFRSKRLLFPLQNGVTRIGRDGDVRPLAFSIVVDHCSIDMKLPENDLHEASITLRGGLGKVWHNGVLLSSGNEVTVNVLDRIVLGDCMTMVRWRNHEPTVDDDGSVMNILTAEEVFAEFQLGLTPSGPGRRTLRRASSMLSTSASVASGINKRMTELGPVVEEVNGMLNILHREMLKCSLAMRFEFDDRASGVKEDDEDAGDTSATPRPVLRIEVRRDDIEGNTPLVLDPHMFMKIHTLLKQEMTNLHIAFSRKRRYDVPISHTPFALFYDHDFTIGTSTQPLHLLWSLKVYDELEPDAKSRRLKSAQAEDPSKCVVGDILYQWKVTESPKKDVSEGASKAGARPSLAPHMTTAEMIGSEWKVELHIEGVSGLKVDIASLYCRYTFLGQTYTTDVVTAEEKERGKGLEGSDNYPIHYTCLHGIDRVTSQFADYVQQASLQIKVIAKIIPHDLPTDLMSTSNTVIEENVRGVFDIVTDLTSEDTPISKQKRQATVHEIESHSFMTDSTKRSAKAALAEAQTEQQRNEILRRARQNDSHTRIMEAGRIGKHKMKSSTMDRVRSVVKMVGKIKREEVQHHLEQSLELKESELDRALQDKSLLQKQQDRMILNVAGFHEPTVDEKDACLSEVSLVSDAILSAETREAAEQAIEVARTSFELNAILQVIFVDGPLLSFHGRGRNRSPSLVSRVASEDQQQRLRSHLTRSVKKAREAGCEVDAKAVEQYKNALRLDDGLTQDQRDAALRALENTYVQRQFIAVQEAVDNGKSAEVIETSCVLLTSKSNQLKNVRSALVNTINRMEELTTFQRSLSQEAVSLHNKLETSAIKSKDAERKLLLQFEASETKVAGLMKDIAVIRHRKEDTEKALARLQSKYVSANATMEKSSETLSKNAQEMNARITNLVSELHTVSSHFSEEISAVTQATNRDLEHMQSGRVLIKKQLEETSQQLAEKATESDHLRGLVRELEKEVANKNAAILSAEAKEALLKSKLSKMKTELEKELGRLQESKTKSRDSEKKISGLEQDVLDHESAKSKLERQLAEKVEELTERTQEIERQKSLTLSVKSELENQEQRFAEEKRAMRKELGEASQEAEIASNSKEHQIRKLRKESAAMQQRLEAELSTIRENLENKITILTADLASSEQSLDETRKTLHVTMKKSRVDLEVSEDAMSAVTTEKTRVEISLKSMTEEKKEYEEECQALKDTVRKLKANTQSTSAQFEVAIQQLNDEIKSKEKELTKVSDEKSEFEEECAVLKDAVKQLNIQSAATISSLEETNEQLSNDVRAKASELQAKAAEMSEFGQAAVEHAQHAGSEALAAQKKEAQAALQNANEQHSRAIASLKEDMRAKRNRDVLSAKHETETEMQKKLETARQEREQSIAELREIKKEHEEAKMILREAHRVAVADRTALESKLGNIKDANVETVRKLEDQVNKLTSASRREEQRSKKRETELVEVKSELSHCKMTSENRMLDLKRDIEQLEEAATENEGNQAKERQAAQREIAQLRDELRETDQTLKTTLRPIEERAKQSARDLMRCKDRLDRALAKITTLEALQPQLDDANAECEAQRRECDRARTSLRESQSQVCFVVFLEEVVCGVCACMCVRVCVRCLGQVLP